MSALGQIFVEVDTRLSAVPTVASYERMPAGDPSAFPALLAYDEGDEPIEGETGATLLRQIVTVEGYVSGGSGAQAHDELTDLHAAAVLALCNDGDLGGLVQSIEIIGQRRVQVSELSSVRRLGFAQDFAIHYATRRGDPSTFA